MLCKTAVAVMMVQQRLGWNCKAPPEWSRHQNLIFQRPNVLSIVFLVFVWAFWYLVWDTVVTWSGRKGVIKYGWIPYPRSPRSHPFLHPPPSMCTCKLLVLKTAKSCTEPCHLHTKFVNDSCALHTAITLRAWKPLWQT